MNLLEVEITAEQLFTQNCLVIFIIGFCFSFQSSHVILHVVTVLCALMMASVSVQKATMEPAANMVILHHHDLKHDVLISKAHVLTCLVLDVHIHLEQVLLVGGRLKFALQLVDKLGPAPF